MKIISINTKSLQRCLFVLISLFFVFLVVYQSQKLFTLDELDFPIVALATSLTGLPIYYRGDFNPNHLGLYHPPLYIYSLALFIKFFGFNELIVRFFGVLCILITSFISSLILKSLIPNVKSGNVYIVFACMYLLHPYVIANATLPDIDQTVLPVTISLFIYILTEIFIHDKANFSIYSKVTIISLFFTLCLWAKLTTPLILIPMVFLILYFSKYSLTQSFVVTISFATIGFLLFLISYVSYCSVFGLPYTYTFSFLLQSFAKGTSTSGGLHGVFEKVLTNLAFFREFLNWITLPLLSLMIISATYLLIIKHKASGQKIILVIFFISLSTATFYIGLISPFGGFFKYPFPVIPFLLFPIVFLILDLYFNPLSPEMPVCLNHSYASYSQFSTASTAMLIITFAVAFLVRLFLMRDHDFLTHAAISKSNFFIISVISLFIGCAINSKKRLFLKKYVLPALISCSLGNAIALSCVQANAAYPTKYEYGQVGMSETVDFLKANNNHIDPIWSMKDIGFYVNNKYIENYGDIFSLGLEAKLENYINNYHVKYFVVTNGIGEDRVDASTELQNALAACCSLDRKFGNFIIYKARLK